MISLQVACFFLLVIIVVISVARATEFQRKDGSLNKKIITINKSRNVTSVDAEERGNDTSMIVCNARTRTIVNGVSNNSTASARTKFQK